MHFVTAMLLMEILSSSDIRQIIENYTGITSFKQRINNIDNYVEVRMLKEKINHKSHETLILYLTEHPEKVQLLKKQAEQEWNDIKAMHSRLNKAAISATGLDGIIAQVENSNLHPQNTQLPKARL